MPNETELDELLPELDLIEDPDPRTGVRDAWLSALEETGIESLESVPWFPPVQRELELPEETLLSHVRDVTACAFALAETLIERRGAQIDMDTLVAGALLHDVSKLYEFDEHDTTPVGALLGHPYYGVHVVARAGLPTEIAHIVLSHTRRTNVEPATLEAEIVRRADEAAAAAIRMEAVSDLRDAV
jgi:putative nucleotidyltransferase with HDIG domain